MTLFKNKFLQLQNRRNNFALKYKFIFLYLMILMSFSKQLFGQYLPTDWRSTMAIGVGESTTAWTADGAALFYNPAGLSLLHNRHSNHVLLDARSPIPDEIEANTQVLLQIEANPQAYVKNILDAAYKNPGKPSYLSIQSFPYFILGVKNSPTFLIGFPIRTENTALFVDQTTPNRAKVNSINTASGALAIADSTKLGGLRWGISARPNYRIQYENKNYSDTGENFLNTYLENIQNQGIKTTAIALDAGFIATVSDYWFPTIAGSVRNIPTGCVDNYIDPITYKNETMCGTIRHGGDEQSPNESRIDPTEVRAGLSLTPRGRIGTTLVNLRLTADIYPIPITVSGKNYSIPSIETANLIHAGGELFFGSALAKRSFSLQAGYMNQQATWGGAIHLYLFILGYSSYIANSAVLNSTGTVEKYTERRHLLYLGWQL